MSEDLKKFYELSPDQRLERLAASAGLGAEDLAVLSLPVH